MAIAWQRHDFLRFPFFRQPAAAAIFAARLLSLFITAFDTISRQPGCRRAASRAPRFQLAAIADFFSPLPPIASAFAAAAAFAAGFFITPLIIFSFRDYAARCFATF